MITSNGGGVSAVLGVGEGQSSVTQVTAVGAPGVTITYSITGGADASRFTINPATGALSFVDAPDFEQSDDAGGDNVYEVIVSATDGASFTDTQTLSVSVADRSAAPRLITSPGFEGGIGGTATVFLTTGFQDISIIDEPGTITLLGPPGGDDIIRFAGAASAYTIARVGSQVEITDGDTLVSIPVSPTGINVVFADGPRTLVVTGDGVQIGSQIAVATPAVITAPAETDPLPNLADPAARARLIVAEGSPITVDGNIDVFGTNFDDETIIAVGGDIAIRGGFTGGDDTVVFEDPASAYTAARSGSIVFIEGPGLRISIPISPGGTKLAFADGERLLKLDTATGKILIGDREIGLQPTPLDNAPVVANAIADQSVAEDTAWSFVVPANAFIDADNAALSFSASLADGSALPAWLSFNASTRTFSGTPPLNFNGNIDLRVTASDGSQSALDTFRLSVTPVNDVPVAAADAAAAVEDGAVLFGSVAANDSDPDTTDVLVYTMAAPVAGLTLNANGAYSFNPSNAAYQLLAFGQTQVVAAAINVSDGKGGTATSTLTITITGTNDEPVAGDDAAAVLEGATLIGSVTANDGDLDADDVLSYTLAAPVAGLTLNANGTYNFDASNAAYNSLAAGQTRAVVANIGVSDGNGAAATSTLTITVTGTNDAPVITSGATGAIAENAAITTVAYDVNATDVDANTTLTYSLVADGDAAAFNIDSATGEVTLKGSANFESKASYAITVRATDNGNPALFNDQVVTITVTDVNEAPVAADDAFSMDENTVLSRNVLTNDVDPDGDALSATVTRAAANGSVTLNPTTGAFDYTPNRNFFGSDSFEYTISDGSLSSTATVTITVINVNEPPVGTADSYSTDEDTTLNVIVANGVLFNDNDIDSDPLTAVLETGPANGTLTLNPNGSFSYTPNANFNGTDSFTYFPNDGFDDGAPVLVNITVNPVNDAPIGVPDAFSTNEDQALIITLSSLVANDTDVENQAIAVAIADNFVNGSLSLIGGNFVFTPSANFFGTGSFTYRPRDAGAFGSETTVTITVNPVNDAPVVANPIADQAFDEDTVVNFTVPAGAFTDVDNAALTYSAALAGGGALPSWLNFNATTRTFSGTPTPLNFNGALDIRVTASDGEFSANDVFTLTITPVNDAPDAVNDAVTTDEDTPISVVAGPTVGLLANDTDVDGPSLSISQVNGSAFVAGSTVNLASGATVTVQADGSYTYNPNGQFETLRPGDFDTDSFTYTITDGSLTDTATVTIRIDGRNERPIAVNDALSMTGNTPITITAASLLTNDSDPDGATTPGVTLTAVGDAMNGTVTLSGGSITFTPNTGFTGAASFTYTIQDADGDTATGTVNVTVDGLVWYVDNSFAGVSDGSFARPFTSLAPLNGVTGDGSTDDDVDGTGNTIFVARTGTAYTGGITLEAGQKLFGDGHEFEVNGIQIGSGVTTNPLINYSTYGITLSTDNEIRGLTIRGTSTSAVGIQDGNGTVGELKIAGVSVGGNPENSVGKAVDIDQGGNLAVSFDSLISVGSTSEGVHLQGISGSFVATSGFIEFGEGRGFLIGAAGGGTANSGGDATITFGGTILANDLAAVEIQDRTGGVITFSKEIQSSAGQVIVADGNAGTINFTGESISVGQITPSSSTAISLTNNSAAINFALTGSGLDIFTTTGNGFIVDGGGGTITLTGSQNRISTTSGRAVEIDGVTIGTGGVNFQSVNITNGTATTGIFLRNAGSGGFNITGTGGSTTGGTISSIDGGANASVEEGIGIYIENTNNISLSNMAFTGNFGNFGIRGSTVNNFTLRNSTFNASDTDDGGFGNSSDDDEGTIRFTGLTGTALFEGNNISDGHEDVLRIDNSAGTLSLTVRDAIFNQAVIGRNGTTSGNDGIIVNGSGTSNITVLIDGVQFTGSRGDMIQTEASGTATQNVTIRNNTFANLHPDIVSGGGGITVALSGGTGGGPGVTYLIEDNTFTGSGGTVILTQALGPAGQMSGRILDNVIGTPGGGYNGAQATTGTNGFGNGIEVRVEKESGPDALSLTHAVRIEGNTIRDISGDAGIFLRSNGAADATGTARLEATVVNNTIAELGPNAFSGIYAQLGGSPGGDGLLGLNIEGNVVNLTGATSALAAVIFDDEASAAAEFYLPGYTGTFTEAALADFLTGPEGNTITVPLLVDIVAFAPATSGPSVSGANFQLPVPLMVQAGFAPTGGGVEATLSAVEALRDAAIQLWIDAGASDAQIAAMRAITVSVGDLYGGFLGQTTTDGIVIDSDAAGYGWFIDATPLANEEFTLGASGLTALAASSAAQGIDLLTAIAHELGHVAGLDDLFDDAAGVMDAFLAPGERNLPEAVSAAGSGTIMVAEVVSGHVWDAISMMPYDARVL